STTTISSATIASTSSARPMTARDRRKTASPLGNADTVPAGIARRLFDRLDAPDEARFDETARLEVLVRRLHLRDPRLDRRHDDRDAELGLRLGDGLGVGDRHEAGKFVAGFTRRLI